MLPAVLQVFSMQEMRWVGAGAALFVTFADGSGACGCCGSPLEVSGAAAEQPSEMETITVARPSERWTRDAIGADGTRELAGLPTSGAGSRGSTWRRAAAR